MATKAEFQGICQICGSMQKLPRGVLSKHGYDVRWGFFNGVCTGAGHLPFEQSKDLIEGAIEHALKSAEVADAHAVELEKPATAPLATCRIYRESSQCKSYEKPGYAWVTGAVARSDMPRHGMWHTVTADDGRVYSVHANGHRDDALAVATQQNREYAKVRRNDAKRLREYAEWQRRRIANWKPQELTPVPPEVEKVHFEADIYRVTTAFCAGSARRARDLVFEKRTTDRNKVTCAACLRKLASRDREAEREAEKQAKRAARGK